MDDKTKINIEMQVHNHAGFLNRVMYYSGDMVRSTEDIREYINFKCKDLQAPWKELIDVDPVFKTIRNAEEEFFADKDLRWSYHMQRKAENDHINDMNASYREGKEEGRVEGRAEGKAEGIAIGEKRGMAIGEEKAFINNIKALEESGFSFDDAVKMLKLSDEKIKAIRKALNLQ